MSDLILFVRAPSNIALIKYMGKKDSASNLPENSSVSLTLNSLCTIVQVRVSCQGSGSVRWAPDKPAGFSDVISHQYPCVAPPLTDHGISKVLSHFERVQRRVPEIFPKFGLRFSMEQWKTQDYLFQTGNTFPTSSGIASSASAFAALTLASASALASDPSSFERAWQAEPELRRELARISRQGSGSSCRSFEGPWVIWQEESAVQVQSSSMPALAHFVILIKTDPKRVPSSDAHTWVKSSTLWEGRVNRAEARIQKLVSALQSGNIAAVAQIAWVEFWEMHSLFHTCAHPFSYWEPGTVEGMKWFAEIYTSDEGKFQHRGGMSPPIVTLDAGPNIHVIIEKKYRELWRERLQSHFNRYVILEDEQGEGASIMEMRGIAQ